MIGSDSRIVMMPFSYDVQGTRPKCKAVEPFRYISAVPVEIRTVDADAAPVAVSYAGFDAFPDAIRRPFELRLHDGMLYGPVDRFVVAPAQGHEPLEVPPRALLSSDDLAPLMDAVLAGTIKTKWPNYPLELDRTSFGFSRSSHVPKNSLRTVQHDDHDAAHDRAAAVARNAFVVVDGIVHVREDEPVWVVDRIMDATTYRAYVRPARSWENCKQRDMFRFDRRDDAIALAASLSRAPTPLEAHDAGLVDWSFENSNAMAGEWARSMVETINHNGSESILLDNDFLMDLIQLRRAIAEGTTTMASVHGMHSRMSECIHRSTKERSQFPGYFDNASEVWLKRLELFGHEHADAVELDGFVL